MRSALLTVLLLAPVALAQTQPATQPQSSGAQSPGDVLNEMLKPGAADKVKPLQPVAGTVMIDRTTSNPVAPNARPLTLMREGSYVVDKTGRMTKSADGLNWEFTFEADQSNMTDPPVVLLPCLKLMMMQDQIKSASRDLRFRVTGMVTEYMGRNYLLLDKVVVVSDQ